MAPLRPLSAAQRRTVTVALELFSRHGVSGTSLQMIADKLGVTKAAVYHQFRTKEEIALAAAESELRSLLPVVEAAEAETSARQARETLLAGMVSLAIESRHKVRSILGDPFVVDFFDDHDLLRNLIFRMRHILVPRETGAAARLRPALLIATISGAVLHPFVKDVDDDILRDELLRLGRRFLGLR